MRLRPEEFRKLYDEVTQLIHKYAASEGVPPKDVRSRKKNKDVARVRAMIAKELRLSYYENTLGYWGRQADGYKPLSFPNIGKLLNVDHSTIIKYMKE